MFKSIWGLGDKYFRRTKLALINIAEWTVREWEKRLLTDVSPRWWGRMAVSNGNINYVKTPYGIRIFYTSKGEYDYMDVVENGRGSYDIKQAFARSDRRREKKKGGWYMIVPFTTDKDEEGNAYKINAKNSDINSTMKKVGEYSDKSGQLRGKFEYSRGKGTTGKGNVYRFPQKTKGGKTTYSYAKFVSVSDRSSGWIYPAVPAHKIAETLEREANKMMQSGAFKKAVERDTEQWVQEELRKGLK